MASLEAELRKTDQRYAVRKVFEKGSWGSEYWPDGAADHVACTPVDADTWECRAGELPHLEIVGEPGNVEFLDVIVRTDEDQLPGWAIRVRFVSSPDGLRMIQREERERPPEIEEGVSIGDDGEAVQYHRRRGPKPAILTSSLIRDLGLGNVSDHLKALMTNTVIRERILGAGWNRPQVRPRRKQQDDHMYALWANRYVWALEQPEGRRSPNAYIADVDTRRGSFRTRREVENRVQQARSRGVLTRSERGRAGGELTDYGLSLLEELDVEPGSDRIVTDGTYETPGEEQ